MPEHGSSEIDATNTSRCIQVRMRWPQMNSAARWKRMLVEERSASMVFDLQSQIQSTISSGLPKVNSILKEKTLVSENDT